MNALHSSEIKTSKDPRAAGGVAHALNVGSNLVLAAAKLSVGLFFRTEALIADGLNHAGDVFHTLVAWVGFRIAEKPADEGHPYGHGNAESIAGVLIGLILLSTGAFILYQGIQVIVRGQYAEPSWISLLTALLSIPIKEGLARYSFRIGKQLNSPSLLAVAQDHRSDVFVSSGAVIGIAGAMLGWPLLDPIGAIFIGVYIAGFLSFPVLRANFDVLMDAAPRDDLADRVRNRFQSDPQVHRVDSIRIHPLGPYYEVDLEITVDGGLTVREGHAIAHRVRDQIVDHEKHVREVKVHVNPSS